MVRTFGEVENKKTASTKNTSKAYEDLLTRRTDRDTNYLKERFLVFGWNPVMDMFASFALYAQVRLILRASFEPAKLPAAQGETTVRKVFNLGS